MHCKNAILNTKQLLLLLCFCCAINGYTSAQSPIHLPWFFGNNMVLQRQKPVKVWGTAKAGSSFSISFAGKSNEIMVDGNGKWQTTFAAMQAGGPYEMKIMSDSSFSFKNIMMGDVWLCSGQSNMEWTMLKTFNASYALQHADYPLIRCLTVPKSVSSQPKDDIEKTAWKIATPQDAYEFSAVAFFFAKELHDKYHVPVGIIHSSWGGTPIEAWTGFDSIASHTDFKEKAVLTKENNKAGKTAEALQILYADSLQQYQSILEATDKGYMEEWYQPSYKPAAWGKLVVPSLFIDTLTDYKGSIWLRKTFNMPSSLAGKALVLNMEVLNERDITWFNGTIIGTTGWSPGRRTYRVPAALVHKGENNITIRLENAEKTSGFQSRNAADIRLDELVSSDKAVSIPLSGDWNYSTGLSLQQYPKQINAPSLSSGLSVLYNAMIAPFKDLGLKGFTWYQGEANASRAYQYRSLLPMMINNWRAQFNQGNLPFLFVQLAGFGKLTENPVESDWAELREAQLKTLSLPNTGMAVTIDVGNPYDVHPTDKQTVAKRLAAEARKIVYGDTSLQTSPLYQSSWIKGDTVHIKVSNAHNGLTTRGAVMKSFAIAGNDKHFIWANAIIHNDEILVWSKEVHAPVAVRYSWAGSPVESNGANVYNKEGFPLSPFRTDEWRR